MTTDQPIVKNHEATEDGCILTLELPQNLCYFEGHFPDKPILAGVVQLEWAIVFGREYLDICKNDVTSVEVLKFQQLTVPGSTIKLTLTAKSDNKFTFGYASDVGNHASGRIKLGDGS